MQFATIWGSVILIIRRRTASSWLKDAEEGWFVRVNHIEKYGTDHDLEGLTIAPPRSLLFLNIDTVPGGTALIWDHIYDNPDTPCPNPRVIIPRGYYPRSC